LDNNSLEREKRGVQSRAERKIIVDKKERRTRITTKKEERKVLVSKAHIKGPSRGSTCS
jgi:hypothetical protein